MQSPGQEEAIMKGKGWTIGILGVWLALAGFLGFNQMGNLWDDLTVGALVAVVGFWIVEDRPWQGWLSGLLGLWMIISAFIPTLLTGTGALWNNLLSGLLIAVAGFAALGGAEDGAMKHSAPMHEPVHHH
jgi:hypothetical protein